jgi:succinoglycan biosynthesis transport protein ExoP
MVRGNLIVCPTIRSQVYLLILISIGVKYMMQEEIRVREIIETIWNGKWIIIVITIVAMVITGVYSYFLLSPTYESVSTIRVGATSSLVEGEKSQQDLYSYADSVKTDVALNRIIDKLKLDRNEYSINYLRGEINVELVKDSNVMKLRVQGNVPSISTSIANLLAYELGARIEISDRSQKIVESKKRLNELRNLIVINNKEIEETINQLGENPEKLVIKQTLADEPYLQSILEQSTDVSNKDLGALQLQTESINPVYTALKQRIADKAIEVTVNSTEQQNLETIINENETQIEQLEEKIDEVKLTALKSERLLSEFSAVFVSPAMKPVAPIGPRKLLNVTVAAIFGVIFSLIFVFARQYWRNTSEPRYANKGVNISI